MLEVRGLAKSYKGRSILRDVNLQVEKGQTVGLLGPNGAGKTTCFYMIVGLISVDHGQIFLDGEDITRKAIHERAQAGLGYLPQEASVFRKLTVAENILSILETRKELNLDQRKGRLEQLLDELQIGHIQNQKGQSLSGGERRRVEIARALAAEPAYILLDEPFAGVDPISVVEIQKIIQHLRARDIGVLITDHNVRETLGICDHACILGNGQVLASGDPASVLANQQVREVYLGEHFKL